MIPEAFRLLGICERGDCRTCQEPIYWFASVKRGRGPWQKRIYRYPFNADLTLHSTTCMQSATSGSATALSQSDREMLAALSELADKEPQALKSLKGR